MKSKILLLQFIILCISISCQKDRNELSQNNCWVKVANFVGQPTRGAASFAIGTNGYIVSGTTGNILLSQVYQYNSTTGAWAAKSNFPGSARLHATGFAIGTKGYVGLGRDNNNLLADFWEYNSLADTWTKLSDFPGGVRAIAVSLVINGKAYVISGFSSFSVSSNHKDVWEFNPQNNSWIQKADFQGTARSSASRFVIGNKGYFGTGTDENDFWEYNPFNDSWIQKKDFPGTSRGEALGFSIENMGYLGCGSSFANGTMTLHKDLYSYDPINDNWIKIEDFSGDARTMAVGFAVGAFGYFGIGVTLAGQNLIDFWKFSPNNKN